MAVDAPVLVNDFFVYLRDMIHAPYGSVHLSPTEYQIWNAYQMRNYLQIMNYGPKAIAGVIGCAQVESGITPGAIQKYSVLPNGAETINDVPNSYMLQYYTPTQGGDGYGLGLLQWDRYSSTYQTNDLLGWTNANNYDWYDGVGQMARLNFEYNNNAIYNFWRLNYGSALTWEVYKDIENSQFSSYSAAECANVWTSCWELSSLDPTGRQYRRDNAEYWYTYFNDNPTPPPSPPPSPGQQFPTWMVSIFNKKKTTGTVKRILKS